MLLYTTSIHTITNSSIPATRHRPTPEATCFAQQRVPAVPWAFSRGLAAQRGLGAGPDETSIPRGSFNSAAIYFDTWFRGCAATYSISYANIPGPAWHLGMRCNIPARQLSPSSLPMSAHAKVEGRSTGMIRFEARAGRTCSIGLFVVRRI